MGWPRALLSVLLLAGCQKPSTSPRQAATEEPIRITMFYASAPAVPIGDSTLLCYGVANAVAVRLEPPVEQLKPALTRCFSVSPAQATTYKLTAEDRQGRTASQSVEIKVTPPLPKFLDLSINSKEIAPGQQ